MYYDDGYTEAATTGLSIFFTVMWIACLAIYVLAIIGFWKMFEKAGEPGWKALIPIYNLYILFKIAWGNGILFLLLFVPAANFIILIMLQFKVARAYGQGDAYAFGLIFLPFIFCSGAFMTDIKLFIETHTVDNTVLVFRIFCQQTEDTSA